MAAIKRDGAEPGLKNKTKKKTNKQKRDGTKPYIFKWDAKAQCLSQSWSIHIVTKLILNFLSKYKNVYQWKKPVSVNKILY